MALRYNAQATASTTLNTLVSGSKVSGNSVSVGDLQRQKVRALCALVAYTLATATLTLTATWEVSNDNSTWTTLVNGSQNAASVVLGTGTVAATTKAVPAPPEVYAFRFARLSLTTGVTTGAAGDLWAVGYCYRAGPAT